MIELHKAAPQKRFSKSGSAQSAHPQQPHHTYTSAAHRGCQHTRTKRIVFNIEMKTPTKSLTAPWKSVWWQQLWIKLAFLRIPNQNIDYLNSKSSNQPIQDIRALQGWYSVMLPHASPPLSSRLQLTGLYMDAFAD